jgi:hypothetical protein
VLSFDRVHSYTDDNAPFPGEYWATNLKRDKMQN